MSKKSLILAIGLLVISACSRNESAENLRSSVAIESGGGSNSDAKVEAVSIKCADFQDASKCMITWSNGQVAPAAIQTIFGFKWAEVPKDGVAVTSVSFTNAVSQLQCLTLYTNGGVLPCGVLPGSQDGGYGGSSVGDSSTQNDASGGVKSNGSSNSEPGLIGTTETTQKVVKPFQVGEVKLYIRSGGGVYQQYFTYLVSVVPNGNIPKSLCLFIDGQPYNGVIGPIAENPPDSGPKQNCINSSGWADSYKTYSSDFGFDFSLKEYPGAIEGDRHEVSVRWEFVGAPAINSQPRALVFLSNGRWTWQK